MRLIGRECKCSNVLSWPILIGRGLDLKELRESDLNEIESRRNNFYELNLWKDLKLKRVLLCSCQFLEEENWTIVVTIARRIHLFPFRTQKLSFSTPKVVNGTLFARIGSCHFFYAFFCPAYLKWTPKFGQKIKSDSLVMSSVLYRTHSF